MKGYGTVRESTSTNPPRVRDSGWKAHLRRKISITFVLSTITNSNLKALAQNEECTEELRTTIYILLLSTLLSLTSCMALVKSIYGVQDAKIVTDRELEEFSTKLKIPSADSYSLDTNYLTYLYSFDTTTFKHQIQNHYQPLQALYFDKTGRLAKYYINCYAGGFPILKWNRKGNLKDFPPKGQAPLDTLLTLDQQLALISVINNAEPLDFTLYDYTVFIYWNHFMKRHSRHLIKSIRKNCGRASVYNVKIVYVNNDNFFVHFFEKSDRTW